MTESLKFGPEWLRNSLSNSPPKEDAVSRPILSDNRYSREEFLGLLEESKTIPEILPHYKRMYVDNWQTPLALMQYEEERPVNCGNSRLFINSNMKHSYWKKHTKDETEENWRFPVNKETRDPPTNSKFPMKTWRRDKSVEPEPRIESNRTSNFRKDESFHKVSNDSVKSSFEFANGHKKDTEKKPETDSSLMACELNLHKLEKDLLMNFSDLTIDSEKKPPPEETKMITWFYIDPIGRVQGPFSQEEMTIWYQYGFFHQNLMIRRSIDNNFISLKNLIHAFGNVQPFAIASHGFPLPKFDNQNETIQQQTFKPAPLMSQPNQWNNLSFQDPQHYQNIQQFSHNLPQNYQYQPDQPPQMDPRLFNMTNGNHQFMPTYNNMGISLQNRPPALQQPVQVYHQPNLIKTPIINQYQHMIRQMPAIVPQNPIDKLLIDLQKQNDRQLAIQNQLHVAAIQTYFNHQNGINPANAVEIEAPKANFDDNGGEFRLVGNVKRKKVQKEARENVKEAQIAHLPKQVVAKVVKSSNADTNGNRKSREERSKLPALPAPWINNVRSSQSVIDNLKRIQHEEEEQREYEKLIELEEQYKKEQEMKRKSCNLTWNAVLVDNLEGSKDSIFNNHKSNNRNGKKQRKQPLEEPKNLLNIEKENEFKNWCIELLGKMNTTIDIPVFVNFLAGLESPYEIEDYAKMYLGDSIETILFTRKFLERRSSYRKATKIVEIDDDLCAPPRAINPGAKDDDGHKMHNRKKQQSLNNNNNNNNVRKTRKTMKVADVNILGFKATAASNRIVGELHDEY